VKNQQQPHTKEAQLEKKQKNHKTETPKWRKKNCQQRVSVNKKI